MLHAIQSQPETRLGFCGNKVSSVSRYIRAPNRHPFLVLSRDGNGPGTDNDKPIVYNGSGLYTMQANSYVEKPSTPPHCVIPAFARMTACSGGRIQPQNATGDGDRAGRISNPVR